RPGPASSALHRDRGVVRGAGEHDVPAHGADERSAPAPRVVRGAEHAALVPERRDLSAAGIPEMDARARNGRSVHLCGARPQEPAAQEHRLRGDLVRPAVPRRLLGAHHDRGHAPLQAHAVMTARRHAPNGEAADTATHERLLAAATRLFAQRVLHAVSVRVIAHAAGANVAAANYRVDGKRGLYRAVVRAAVQAMRAGEDGFLTAGLD